MSMMEIMDRLVMSEASNGSAGGTEYPAVRKQAHQQYAIEVKRRIVEETFAPGASVSVVARRHDVNANLVFDWRKKYRQGKLADRKVVAKATLPAPDLIRIGVVEHGGGIRPLPSVPAHSVRLPPEAGKAAALPSPRTSGLIEIELGSGIKVRVDAGFDEAMLRRVLAVIKELA